MQCECCGRETDVLIAVGEGSPKISVTGRCFLGCCVLILKEPGKVGNRR